MLRDEEHQEFIKFPVKELVDDTIDMLITALAKVDLFTVSSNSRMSQSH